MDSVNKLFQKVMQDKEIAGLIKSKSKRSLLKEKEAIRKWKNKNPDKVRDYAKKYRTQNKSEIITKQRANYKKYFAEHKEQIRSYNRRYYNKYILKMRGRSKINYLKNKSGD